MKRLFKYNVKLFVKSRILFISFLLLLGVCAGYLIDTLNLTEINSYYISLAFTLRFSIAGFIFFAFIAYEYISSARRVHLEETVRVIKNGRSAVYLQKLLFLLIPILLYSVVIAAFNIALYYINNINYAPYLAHIIKSILLNITFTAVIGAMAGALLALKLSRVTAYLIMIFIAYLISPLPESIIERISYTSDINLYPYWDVFRILPITIMLDYIYGEAIEMYRWNLAYFWMGILGTALFFNVSKRKNYVLRSVCVVLAVLASINFAGYLNVNNDSVVRKDDRKDGYYHEEFFYYNEQNGAVKNDPADFSVLSYDMRLGIDRRLVASVDMVIETVPEKESYRFTLFRGYTIKSIEDANGNELKYSRDGDYLEILNRFEGETAAIHIEYEGSGIMHYSNAQGVALLGYFPYYPMAGYLPLWDRLTDLPCINTDFPQKHFSIKADCPLSLVSNIKKTGKNTFEGTSGTASLIGGFTEESESAGIAFTYSPINKKPLIRNNGFGYPELESALQKIKALIGDNSGLSFAGKKIMTLPDVFLINVPEKDVICFDDHILTYASPYDNYLCSQYIKSAIPYSEYKENMKSALFGYVLFAAEGISSEQECHEPKYSDIEILKMDIQTAGSQGMINAYMFAQDEYYNLFLYKVKALGADYVMKTAYKYLLDESNETNDVDYLFNLE